MTALSPRTPAPRLRSTVVAQYGTPRREMSKEQRKALAAGFTLRAGPKTMARLHRGYPTRKPTEEN